MSDAARVKLTRWGLVALALVIIELLPRLGIVDRLSLVPLTEMVRQLWLLIADGILQPHLVRTLTAIVVAGVAATVTGLPLGVLLWRLQPLRRVRAPYLTTYYAIPVFAFYPLFIAVFGLGVAPVILIAWAWAVVAIVLNTVVGLNQVPEVRSRSAAACASRRGGCSPASTSRRSRRTSSPGSSSR